MATASTSSVKSVAAGTKVSSIGTVKSIVGTVTATDANGVTRTLQVGDKVFTNDVIQTSAAGAILIEFINGSHMDLGRDSKLALDLDVFNPNQAAEAQSDIASVQALIAAGADPTQITEATAAGPTGAGGGEEGGSSFVVVDQAAPQGLVTSGFPTGPISTSFEQPTGELPIVEEEAVVIPNTPPTLEITPPTYTPPGETPPPDAAPGGEVLPGQVFEEGLAGPPVGTNADHPSEIATGGTIVVGDADGLADIASISIGSETFTIGSGGITTLADLVGQTVDGEHGTLTITAYDGNGTFTYSYELTEATTDDVNDFDSFAVTVTDTTGASAGGTISISIIDDVPDAEALGQGERLNAVLDESPLPEDGDGIAEATISAGVVQSMFAEPFFGADGAGSVSYALALDGTDVGSGLYALDATDTSAGDGDGIGQGDEILLNQSGNTITGSAGSTDYFT
ncbi:MAG: retention module-containing protein, partial [Rhodocyclales bacterium]|nr:retention module-containing protein [Rhodocyclales bacterium]